MKVVQTREKHIIIIIIIITELPTYFRPMVGVNRFRSLLIIDQKSPQIQLNTLRSKGRWLADTYQVGGWVQGPKINQYVGTVSHLLFDDQKPRHHFGLFFHFTFLPMSQSRSLGRFQAMDLRGAERLLPSGGGCKARWLKWLPWGIQGGPKNLQKGVFKLIKLKGSYKVGPY